MPVFDETPKTLTVRDLDTFKQLTGHTLRCYMCGKQLTAGETVRFVSSENRGVFNAFVCRWCDGVDVLDRWENSVHTFNSGRFHVLKRLDRARK